MVASEGQTFMMLCSALLLFKLLKAFLASTNSVVLPQILRPLKWFIVHELQPQPLSQSCKELTASCTSSRTRLRVALRTICVRTSPTPIDLTPGHLSKAIHHATNDVSPSGSTKL